MSVANSSTLVPVHRNEHLFAIFQLLELDLLLWSHAGRVSTLACLRPFCKA